MKFGELFVDNAAKNAACLYAQWCLVNNIDFDAEKYKELTDAFIAGVAWAKLNNPDPKVIL